MHLSRLQGINCNYQQARPDYKEISSPRFIDLDIQASRLPSTSGFNDVFEIVADTFNSCFLKLLT